MLAVPQFMVPDEAIALCDEALFQAAKSDLLSAAKSRRMRDKILRGEIAPMMGGAEIFPDEGLTYILNVFPRVVQTTGLTANAMGLFTAGTATTVPARGTVLAGNPAAVGEPAAANGYARVAMANTVWAAPAVNGNGVRTTASQQQFPDSTGAWNVAGATIKGFFVATSATQGAGIALYYANFDDGQAIDVNAAGYTIRVTPFWQQDG